MLLEHLHRRNFLQEQNKKINYIFPQLIIHRLKKYLNKVQKHIQFV